MKKNRLLLTSFVIGLVIGVFAPIRGEVASLPVQFQVWGKTADRCFKIPSDKKETKPPYPTKLFYSKEKEYWINAVNYLSPVYSNAYIDDRWNGELTAIASIGEYEPLAFSVHSQKPLMDCKISVTDLKDGVGNAIPVSSIDIRIVRGRPQLCGINGYYSYPFFLESADLGADIAENTTQEYWMTIKVPDDAKAGTYKGILSFEPSNASKARVSINFKVLPIHLKDAKRNFYMYYNVDPSWKGFYAHNLHKDLVDMKEHGINSLCIYIVPELINLDGILSVNMDGRTDFSLFTMDKFVSEYLRVGFKGPIINEGIDMAINYYAKNQFAAEPGTPKSDEIIKKLVESIYSRQKWKGWPLMFMSPADEPSFTKERMELCKHYLRLIKGIDRDIVTAVTLNGAVRGINDITCFDPLLDIKICAYVDETILEEIKDGNSQFWLYNGGSFGKYPAVDRLFFGFYAEKVNAQGVGQWAYQWPNPSARNESLYSELKYGQYGWYYTCPSPGGPLPTIGWEGVREGIDDARYVATLRNLINRARRLNNKSLLRLADDSEKYLEDILNKIPISFHRQQGEEKANREILEYFGGNLETLNRWRYEIADRIIKLQMSVEDLK